MQVYILVGIPTVTSLSCEKANKCVKTYCTANLQKKEK